MSVTEIRSVLAVTVLVVGLSFSGCGGQYVEPVVDILNQVQVEEVVGIDVDIDDTSTQTPDIETPTVDTPTETEGEDTLPDTPTETEGEDTPSDTTTTEDTTTVTTELTEEQSLLLIEFFLNPQVDASGNWILPEGVNMTNEEIQAVFDSLNTSLVDLTDFNLKYPPSTQTNPDGGNVHLGDGVGLIPDTID